MRKLLLGMFLMAFSMGVAGLALPLYARDLGATYTEIGMLGVAYVLFDVLFSIPAGRAGDRWGHKPLLVIGFLATALTITSYYLAGAVIWLILLRFVQGAAEAPIWVNAQSAAAALSDSGRRGRAIGSFGVSWGLGFGLGPVVGGLLYAGVGAAQTFLISGVFAFAGAAVVLTMPAAKTKVVKRKPNITRILPACFAGMVYVGIIAIIYTIFPVYATNGLGMTEFQAGLLITVFSVARAILFLPLGRISDRVGYRHVLLAGLLGSSLASAAIALISGLYSITAMILLLAVAEGATYPAVVSAISKEGEGGNLGYVIGIYNAVAMIGWGLFPGVGGALADVYGPTSPFLMSAGIGLLSALILWIVLHRD